MKKLEERAGADARRLFEAFLGKIDKLQEASASARKLQQMVVSVIFEAEKPVTYAEIVGVLLQEHGVNDPNTEAAVRPRAK